MSDLAHKPALEYDTSSAMCAARNSYQGDFKRVLCVCSAGLLRSPTAALVLSSSPFYFNTRACGMEYYALIPLTEVLIEWADEIVTMTDWQTQKVKSVARGKPILCLNIPDSFSYRDSELQLLIEQNYKEAQAGRDQDAE